MTARSTLRTVRAFVAIPLPDEVHAALDGLQRRLRRTCPERAVRWVPTRNIHLTTHFLGDIDPARIVPLEEALSVVARNVPPFTVLAEGAGAFPNLRRPRVVWVGVTDASQWLSLLHQVLSESLEQLGFPRETRPFSPHLTLGRIRRQTSPTEARAVGEAVAAAQIGPLGTVPVESLVLFKSTLKPTGAAYSRLATLRLGKPEI